MHSNAVAVGKAEQSCHGDVPTDVTVDVRTGRSPYLANVSTTEQPPQAVVVATSQCLPSATAETNQHDDGVAMEIEQCLSKDTTNKT